MGYEIRNGLIYGAKNKVDVDLSTESKNPVQNKTVTDELNTKPNYNYFPTVTLEEYNNMGVEKLTDGKVYFIPDAYTDSMITTIYGWHLDPTESDPSECISYISGAQGMTPAKMTTNGFSYGSWENAFFMPKPCMVKSDGTVDYYLNQNDYTKKEDGTDSDVANTDYDGNAMMEWPLIWWKYEAGTSEGEGYFYVANKKVDDSYHCWCNYNCDNIIIPNFYTAIYNGTGTTKLRSISGVQLTSANGNGSTTGTQEVTRATANNTTSKVEWYIETFSDRMLINGLLILMGKSLDTQGTFGQGISSGSQAGKEAYITGTLNDKGLFYGDTVGTTTAVKVFGMENYYSCQWHRVAGCVGLADGTVGFKMTYNTADGTTATSYNSTGEGYIINSTDTRPGNGYAKTAYFNSNLGFYFTKTTGGSSSTYFCDYWYTNSTVLTYLRVGGNSSNGAYAGASYFNLGASFADAYWSIGACLSLKPLALGAKA